MFETNFHLILENNLLVPIHKLFTNLITDLFLCICLYYSKFKYFITEANSIFFLEF